MVFVIDAQSARYGVSVEAATILECGVGREDREPRLLTLCDIPNIFNVFSIKKFFYLFIFYPFTFLMSCTKMSWNTCP